jgi:hypothetical protein
MPDTAWPFPPGVAVGGDLRDALRENAHALIALVQKQQDLFAALVGHDSRYIWLESDDYLLVFVHDARMKERYKASLATLGPSVFLRHDAETTVEKEP